VESRYGVVIWMAFLKCQRKQGEVQSSCLGDTIRARQSGTEVGRQDTVGYELSLFLDSRLAAVFRAPGKCVM